MDWLVKGFPHLVLYVFGGLLFALTPILFWCLLERTGALDRLSAATHWSSTRSRIEQMFVLVLLAGVIVYGSTKTGDNSASPRLRVRPMAEVPSTPVITAADVARGWRESGSDAGGPVEMPTGAVTNELLRRRGGFDWAFRVEPDNWRSAWKGGYLTGVTVLARGEVRPDVGTLYFPVPLTNGVSLLPEARWGMLSLAEAKCAVAKRREDSAMPNPKGAQASARRGEGSVFSHAVTTNGSLLLDWRNALVGRDPDTPTNLQMEIFSDGSFVWRTDGGSTSYLPVLPFDWDGDGLENSVDSEPLAPNPVDAHGTSAEWYRVVCSNVFETAGGDLGWKEGVNSNAYYFVDVVAEEGPAPIWFNADRDSRLGSPVVVAWGGETNRVPLLIGVEYAVTSTVPFSVTLQEGGFAEVLSSSDRTCTLKWPLEFSYSARGTGYEVSVGPYDPGGTIAWERTALLAPFDIGGGARLLSSLSPSGCAFTTGERSLTFTCAHCSCAGCSVSGRFSLEGTCHDLGSFCCSCVYDPQDEDEPGGGESAPSTPDSPSVDVRFSRPAVIFEDAYANSPTETVPKQSTSTTVEIEAYGGADGGVVVVSMANPDKLECTSGPSLPTSFMVGPNTRRTISVDYQGNRASGFEDDIVVTAQISDSSSSASVTAVKIDLRPNVSIDGIPCRHVIGVRESVAITWEPHSVSLSMNASQDEELLLLDNIWHYRAPLVKTSPHLVATCQGLSFPLNVEIKEPEYIFVRSAGAFDYAVAENVAGGAGMELALYVFPTNVSFMGIAVQEVPSDYRDPWGYFNHAAFQTLWSHTRARSAGMWHDIQIGNLFMYDVAEMGDVLPCMTSGGVIVENGESSWIAGGMNWMIPVGWNEIGSDDDDDLPVKTFATYWQRFTMSSTGLLKVEKLEKFVERGTNNVIRLNGIVQQRRDLRPR